MNISTGGPHILLFERDQQLATLLVSELQLAGYTNHTARTAVEVFDAIARYPIRLVLVNLAQAAAARREFWVALDSQRRDRKVQVLTFLCTNLAAYGPRDFEDRSSSTMADIEVDGMMGLMSLVDAVRTRVPNESIETIASTMPRIPKVPPAPSSSTASMPAQRTQPASSQAGSSYHPTTTAEMGAQQAATRAYATPLPPTSINNFSTQQSTSPQSNTNQYAAPSTAQNNATAPGYTEKIRAVLYPNQRTWSAQGTSSYTAAPENKESQAAYAPRSYSPPAQPGPSDSALQRLANGQAGGQTNDGANESGLAQLSRMAQGYRSPFREESDNSSTYITTEPMVQPSNTRPSTNALYQPEVAQPSNTRPTTNAPYQTETTQSSNTHPNTNALYQPETTQPLASRTVASTVTNTPQAEMGGSNAYTANATTSTAHTAYASPGTRPTQGTENSGAQTNISTQTLRASPIQDMPIERTTSGPAITENTKRPDVLSRANYGQQLAQIAQQLQAIQQTQPSSPPLASIATSMMPGTPAPASRGAPITDPAPSEPVATPDSAPQEARRDEAQQSEREERLREIFREQENREPIGNGKETHNYNEEKQTQTDSRSGADFEEGLTANNAVLLDIVQSLPPMPALAEQPQSVQPQVLNGRATRSLGKVLLDGHLVPHDRLEVAQNIQRMLRGVDLNYQLGEILLMFKLLTPDQLLAASLVSYGLITTTQISALGRIRQELHAIGLEYDLENLLILFRILTPEQLREVRASLQS